MRIVTSTRQYNHPKSKIIHRPRSTAISLVVFLSVFFAVLVGLPRAIHAQTFYWDGSTPITVQTTYESEYEDSGPTNGNGGQGSSPNIQVYAAGVTPTLTYTPTADGSTVTYSPNPTRNWLPSIGNYQAGGGVSSGTVTDSFTLPASANPGYYYFLVPAMIVQRAPAGSSGVNVTIRSRWISIDSLVVTQQGILPKSPATPPTAYVFATQAVATKGAGNQLQFTFQRVGFPTDTTNDLRVFYTIGGTAPASDYTLGGSSPITIPAGSATATLTATPKNNGVFDSGVTVVAKVASDQNNPVNYYPSNVPAVGTIFSADRPPALTFTTPGIVSTGNNSWALTINANQSFTPTIHAHDQDGNLRAAWIYKGTATPTSNTGVVIPFGSNYLTGYDGDLTGETDSLVLPGQVVYSAWACDTNGLYSPTGTLTVTVINYPPTDVFTTPGIVSTGNNSWGLTIPINTAVNVSAHLHDASGDLAETIIDSIYDDPVHNYNGAPSYRILEQGISGGDVDVSIAQSWSVPGTYQFSSSCVDQAQQLSPTAHLAIMVVDRPPTVQWTTPGAAQYGTDPHYQSVSIAPGQTIAVSTAAADPDGDLAAIFVDLGVNTPPTAGTVWNAQSFNSTPSGTTSQNYTGSATGGDQWFSVRAQDEGNDWSDTYYLRVHTDYPPQVAWNGLAGWGQNATATISVGQTVTVDPVYQDSDGANDAQLAYAWAWMASGTPGTFPPANNDAVPAGSKNYYQRPLNGNGVFAPTAPGTYIFYAAVSDGVVQPPTITLTVTVPNQPPTVAWSVPGAVQVNGNTWELDMQGASAAPTIAATGADPENRLASVLVTRGTGDPSQGQGTPFASSASSSTGAAMTPDEMRPPLSTSLDSATWEQANQDNYSWFSAASTDQDGGHSAPIHLLVRVFNRAPSAAAWTSPANPTPVNATDGVVTVYPNQAAFPLAATSSDPEQKMAVTMMDRGYDVPQASGAGGNAVAVGGSPDGTTAATSYTPGAETFDAVGDHWFSAVGMDKGSLMSGGASPSASHLDVKVVNRLPVASFASAVNATTIRKPLAIKAVGTDPDNAMLRVQSVVVAAPSGSGYTAGQVLADTSVPAAAQVYPSNAPIWETDAVITPMVGGSYVVRSYVWDRHGGTAQADMTFSVTDQPPVFAWSQATVHVLAGTAAQLPFTVSDPDGDLNVAQATGPGGYSQQMSFTNLGSGNGSFTFPTTAAGTYTVTGAAFDLENVESLTQPTIQVIVEAVDTAPVATFTSPLPGGTDSTVTHFVDDVVAVNALGTDVDGNLTALQIALGSTPWAQAPSSGNVASLTAGGSFTVPKLGAETSHTWTFSAVATDAGTIPGGTITQSPKTSPAAVLRINVPNRAPTIQWTVPTNPAGLTQAEPFLGYLLQPLKITATGNDRDGNLASVTITQVGGSNAVLGQETSTDGRTAAASYSFTPTVPGLYVFAAQAVDQANAAAEPVNLFVQVQDYPSDSTGTIGAVIISPANRLDQVFAAGTLPIIVKGGVATLGRGDNLGHAESLTTVPTMGASKIIPVPGYLNGTMIPPLAPAIIDLRIESVSPTVDHADPATKD